MVYKNTVLELKEKKFSVVVTIANTWFKLYTRHCSKCFHVCCKMCITYWYYKERACNLQINTLKKNPYVVWKQICLEAIGLDITVGNQSRFNE